nr:hypothetical protein GCM10020093_026250 [Planobispora longispora]
MGDEGREGAPVRWTGERALRSERVTREGTGYRPRAAVRSTAINTAGHQPPGRDAQRRHEH